MGKMTDERRATILAHMERHGMLPEEYARECLDHIDAITLERDEARREALRLGTECCRCGEPTTSVCKAARDSEAEAARLREGFLDYIRRGNACQVVTPCADMHKCGCYEELLCATERRAALKEPHQ